MQAAHSVQFGHQPGICRVVLPGRLGGQKRGRNDGPGIDEMGPVARSCGPGELADLASLYIHLERRTPKTDRLRVRHVRHSHFVDCAPNGSPARHYAATKGQRRQSTRPSPRLCAHRYRGRVIEPTKSAPAGREPDSVGIRRRSYQEVHDPSSRLAADGVSVRRRRCSLWYQAAYRRGMLGA